jgi:MobA-like NTP transferase domain
MKVREHSVGILLAGGKSSRMGGGDKCLLPLAGRPILAHVIERLKPQVAELIISANGEPTRFSDFGLPGVEDRLGGYVGPLAGILAGLEWAAHQSASKPLRDHSRKRHALPSRRSRRPALLGERRGRAEPRRGPVGRRATPGVRSVCGL